MKKNLPKLIFLFCIGLHLIFVQTGFGLNYEVENVTQIGSSGADKGNNLTILPDNSYIAVGIFQDTISVGKGINGEILLTTPSGTTSMYFVKYTSSGIPIWAKAVYSNDYIMGYFISTDISGNIGMTGCFKGSATFGSNEATSATLTSSGERDLFLAKYKSNGDFLWAKKVGGIYDEYGETIKFFTNGEIMISGESNSPQIFVEGSSAPITSRGGFDALIMKYDSDGKIIWALHPGGTNDDNVTTLDIQQDGTILVGGYFFSKQAVFGEGAGQTLTNYYTGTPTPDIFLAKYNPDNSLVWVKQAGGNGLDTVSYLSSCPDGTFIVTGPFSTTATFGKGETNQTALTSKGDSDIYIAKYNSDGTLKWVKKAGGPYRDNGYSIGILSDGYIYVSGYLTSSAYFGENEANQVILNASGINNMNGFSAIYYPDGRLIWAENIRGTYTITRNTANDSEDNLISIGEFSSTATFGKTGAREITKTSAGDYDGFIAKYSIDEQGIIKRYDFDTDSQGWAFAGQIPGFDLPQSASDEGALSISPDGSAHSYGFWMSPSIDIKEGKIYKVSCTLSNDLINSDLMPLVRLRANQQPTWRSWYTTIESSDGNAPDFYNPKTYDFYITPQTSGTTGQINLSYDLMNFVDSNDSNSVINLEKVTVQELTVEP